MVSPVFGDSTRMPQVRSLELWGRNDRVDCPLEIGEGGLEWKGGRSGSRRRRLATVRTIETHTQARTEARDVVRLDIFQSYSLAYCWTFARIAVDAVLAAAAEWRPGFTASTYFDSSSNVFVASLKSAASTFAAPGSPGFEMNTSASTLPKETLLFLLAFVELRGHGHDRCIETRLGRCVHEGGRAHVREPAEQRIHLVLVGIGLDSGSHVAICRSRLFPRPSPSRTRRSGCRA